MTENTIVVRGLRRSYGSGQGAFEAVRGIDLSIAPGTIHALLGINGAGKTSTLEVIEGLARPDGGRCGCSGWTRSGTAPPYAAAPACSSSAVASSRPERHLDPR